MPEPDVLPRLFLIVGTTLSLLSVVMHLTSFVGNGWFIYKSGTATEYYGTWYQTICVDGQECKTISDINDQYSLVGESEIFNNSWVTNEVIRTLVLSFAIGCALLFVLMMCRPKNHRRIVLSAIVCSTISGAFSMCEIGVYFRYLQSELKDAASSDIYTIYFPWSFFMSVLDTHTATQLSKRYKRLKIAGSLICAISLNLQIIGYSGNGWRIVKNGYTTYYSLWYKTICKYESTCETISIRKLYYDASGILERYYYFNIVRGQVVLTMALMCSVLCLILLCLEMYKPRYVRRIRLGFIVCSSISGVFWMEEIGFELRWYTIFTGETVLFPWSLFIAFFGALLIMSLACAYFIAEMLRNEKIQPAIPESSEIFDEQRDDDIELL